jgi:hypothetical protein
MKTDLVLVDPNTSLDYVKAFREEIGLTVIEVPSSIDKIPGAQTYSALFENMVQALLKGVKEKGGWRFTTSSYENHGRLMASRDALIQGDTT